MSAISVLMKETAEEIDDDIYSHIRVRDPRLVERVLFAMSAESPRPRRVERASLASIRSMTSN